MVKALVINKPNLDKRTNDLANHKTFPLLVDAFAWLIQEDKKQNPELYKNNKII